MDEVDGIDPDRLAVALGVLAEVEQLPTEHPDAVAVRRGDGAAVQGGQEAAAPRPRCPRCSANDDAVTAATATGAPGRIDDETNGVPLRRERRQAGSLIKARACYVCKERYREVDAFYHQLCPACAALNHARREARTDLTGRRALLTGGRAKIGMYIALRLLRDGAHTTITTRFPNDAVRRFSGDARQRATGCTGCASSASTCATRARSSRWPTRSRPQGPLDILINNAAQTVRRSPGAYAHLAAADRARCRAARCPRSSRSARAPERRGGNGHWIADARRR